jgi:Peptidase family M23
LNPLIQSQVPYRLATRQRTRNSSIDTVHPELVSPVVVDFPLRGERWLAVNSPGDRVPSHGTDLLGQRFAFDLLMVDERRRPHTSRAGLLRTILLGVRTQDCYAWGLPIHAPFDAQIVRAVDGYPERRWIHPLRELAHVLWNGFTYRPDRLPQVLGNHVIARSGDVYGAFVHLAQGSVAVKEGQQIRAGDVFGRVGHTGNSTNPHLHFQLMDSVDPLTARGVACAFREYEMLRDDGRWEIVSNGIPRRTDRIRSI